MLQLFGLWRHVAWEQWGQTVEMNKQLNAHLQLMEE